MANVEDLHFKNNVTSIRLLLEGLDSLAFYTPVFRRDVLWCGDVRTSVHPSVRPGLRPSVTVFHIFLLHALTYWAEILYVTFFLWTFDQVRVSLISVNFCWSYAPFGTLNPGNTQFSALFSYMLWHIELKFCRCLSYTCTVLQIKFESPSFAVMFVGVMPHFELRILEINSFPHFSPAFFGILIWNFCIRLFFTVLKIKFECQFASIFCRSYVPVGT